MKPSNHLKNAKNNLEKSSLIADDEFLFNASAQLAKESVQQSLTAVNKKNINKTKDQNSILSLYRDAKPLIEININNHVLNKLAEEDFTESEDRILYREEVEEFLELADTVYKSVKEHFADKKQ